MRNHFNRAVYILIPLFLFFGIFYFLIDLSQFHLFDPYQYSGDVLETYALYGRDYILNDFSTRSFAPYEIGQQNYWKYALNLLFQSNANLIILCYWITGNAIAAVNLFFIFTFPLTFATSYYVFGKLRLPNPYKFAAATLYALMPYHFMRAMGHLFECSYFLTPLMVLILLWIWSARPLFSTWCNNRWVFSWRDRRTLFALVLVIFFSSFHYYHQFFFALLASASALMAAAYRRSWRHLFSGLSIALIAVTVLQLQKMLLAFTSDPSLHLALTGEPVSGYGQSEVYPLKLIQILIPVPGHHWDIAAAIRAIYGKVHPLVNENSTVSLGFAGALGFLATLTVGMLPGRYRLSVVGKFGLLTLTCLLIATMGGFSSVLSTISLGLFGPDFELTQARGWNRIIIYIGFFSYYTFFWGIYRGVHWLHLSCFRTIQAHAIHLPILAVLLGIALWDQVPFKLITQSGAIETSRSDREFFSSIEKDLVPGSKILQLPVFFHHSSGFINKVYYSDGLRPYLATNSLKFSYGADSRSEQARWLGITTSLPPQQQLTQLCKYEFSGVLIHQGMYPNPQEKIEVFSKILGTQPQLSKLQDFAFFPIAKFCQGKSIPLINIAEERSKLLKESTSPSIRFFGPETALRQVGHIGIDSNGEGLVATEAGESGYVAYGPYIRLPRGKYTAQFRVRTNSDVPHSNSVIFDIAESIQQIVSKPLPENSKGESIISISFEVTSISNSYEFRVLTNGLIPIQYYGVRVLPDGS